MQEKQTETKTEKKKYEPFDLDKSGNLAQTIRNCVLILNHDPKLKDAIRNNIFTGKTEISGWLGWARQCPQLTDTDMCNIMMYLEEHYGLTNEKKIDHAVKIVANENCYHPICEYLCDLDWDGKDRIKYALHHFLGAEQNEYTAEVMKLFMMGALRRIYDPGCKFEYMLCLVGGQGAGKSTFFRFLALKDDWFTDDLRRLDDENVYRKLQGHWIVEMPEMIAANSTRSVEEIKSFLSKQKDCYKVPYEVHPQDRPRQCVFGGTSNTLDFLPLDRTGNRRFIPVMVHPENAEVHILDDPIQSRVYIEQMWAEAMAMYRVHAYELTLPKKLCEYMKDLQQNFMREDTKLGMIQEFLDTTERDTVCSKMLFAEALGRGNDEPKQWEIREINDIMNNSITGWVQFTNARHFDIYGRQRGWIRESAADNEQLTTNCYEDKNPTCETSKND